MRPDVRLPAARLRGVRSIDDASRLFAELGYDRPTRPIDAMAMELPGVRVARASWSGRNKRSGYGLLIGEVASLPRSLRPLALATQLAVHDHPLGVIGVPGRGGAWERMVVFRPRHIGGRLGAVTASRLDVELDHPTGHDAEVLNALRWRPELGDAEAQHAVSEAFDVEQVTRRFYQGLRPHFEALEASVKQAAATNQYRGEQISNAGGPRRVAIRILTQILFCYFLQRKGLMAGNRNYLSTAYASRSGRYYPTVLEPLFYEALAMPLDDRPAATASIPFLNGGLFERRYGDVSLDLADEVFDLDEGLLGYLNHWTFTVAEETADEQEVAVDPEMLGRIFESLLPEAEREQKGTYYTPRPVVQFMCREAIIARLCGDGIEEDFLRAVLSAEEPPKELRKAEDPVGSARHLDGRLESLSVIDPAVGSGAFLLGMMGEITRLRGAVHEVIHGRPPTSAHVHSWKLHAIEWTLFGVDVEPTAVELCRLRLWLSLTVELQAGVHVPSLPNLDYRTVCANSLVDFIAGMELQDTRGGTRTVGMFAGADVEQVTRLRAEYFNAAGPARKSDLRNQLLDSENRLLDELLEGRFGELHRNLAARARIDDLKAQLRSPDRAYPIFMPAFSAPEVWEKGGWDVVIMNPPYVGRKQLTERYADQAWLVADMEHHFGDSNDLMVLFGERARELVGPGGVISMIFNDSIFTSTDGDEFRRALVDQSRLRVLARTKCFEGQAVIGGVIIALSGSPDERPVRWIEGFRKPVEDFAGASRPLPAPPGPGEAVEAGAMEVFEFGPEVYRVLPHRPLYRPSKEALDLRERYSRSERWSDFSQAGSNGWGILSNTRALEKRVSTLNSMGMYGRLDPGQWVLLGLVTNGGVGLQTGDDRRFLGAIEGTKMAADHAEFQDQLERETLKSAFAPEYRTLRRDHGDRETALLALWEGHGRRLCPRPWPRNGIFRIVPREQLHAGPVADDERRDGFGSAGCFVPFEKGDQSQELLGETGRTTRIGSAWARENPLVIEWSREAVALLRRRAAAAESVRRPRFQNEHLWFSSGITWNRVASYLRTRVVPEGSMFGDMAPLLRPLAWVEWLSPLSLLALMNTDVADFMLRTFLGSRMHVEVGDLRRLVIPVLSDDQKRHLEGVAGRAIAARLGESGERLQAVQSELNAYAADLYGVSRASSFWVVR